MPHLLAPLARRWRSEAGYRHVLAVALPLILSTSAWSIQHFVDRMFLTWYSTEAIAAAMPAGMLNFTLMSFFLGTAGYVSAFVAQYHGAGRPERIGPAVWQGVYVAVAAGAVLLAVMPYSGAIFDWIGHEPAVRAHEATYFRILCLGAFPSVAASAMAGFFSDRGRTWPIMWVNFAATGVNVVLTYLLIFGSGPIPEMGVAGAAWATVASAVFSFLAYLALLANPEHNRRYRTAGGWRPDGELFVRLMKFGLPNGAQFFLDIAGFSAFMLIVGKLGTNELAASNIALNINNLAFMPAIGCGIAVSVLVGQELGKGRASLAWKAAWSGFHLCVFYMGSVALAYALLPGLFLMPFGARAEPESFQRISEMAVVLLRFVALYSVFDAMAIVLSAAVKGAGDTRFVMVMVGAMSLGLLALPTYLALEVFGWGVFAAWWILTVYVALLAACFLARFLGGKWTKMRVIEEAAPALPAGLPAAPTVTPGAMEG